MKNLYKRKRQEGFTIIEVMIVLAIAAVILLIVLLAVPALQRSSRNTQRANDAGSVAAAVNNCLANQNGQPDQCNKLGVANVDQDTTKLGQLTKVDFTNIGSQPTDGALDTIVVTYDYKCTAPQGDVGTTLWKQGTSRQFILTYEVESTGANVVKCVDG